jgi:hypothetical protein
MIDRDGKPIPLDYEVPKIPIITHRRIPGLTLAGCFTILTSWVFIYSAIANAIFGLITSATAAIILMVAIAMNLLLTVMAVLDSLVFSNELPTWIVVWLVIFWIVFGIYLVGFIAFMM